MPNISKSYVSFLGNALGYEYSGAENALDNKPHVCEYLDVKWVYDWMSKITLESGNPDLGLRVLNNSHPAMLGTLVYAVMSCETLGHALERLAHYNSLICGASFLKINIHDDFLKLERYEIGCKAPRAFIDSCTSFFLSIMKWLVPNRKIHLLEVEFVYPEPDSLDLLREAFGKEIKFSAKANSLVFDKEIYNYPLVTASPKLDSLHSEVLKAELQGLYKSSVSAKVRSLIIEDILAGSISSLKSISRLLKVSTRSVQYSLRAEGETFRGVLESARKELAHHLIKNTDYNFKYICATLGFCDKSSFHKSSLRWFGMTPKKYRELVPNNDYMKSE